MKWKAQSMLDPGDGIVTVTEFEHESDDLVEVAADLMNGDIVDKNGDRIELNGWIFGLEAVGDD